MYATAYVVLAQDSAAFWPRTARPTSAAASSPTDAFYFTLTVFSTLGFGDITVTSQNATVIVMVQMVLDLVILGLGVQVYRGAVSMGRNRSEAGSGGRRRRNRRNKRRQSAHDLILPADRGLAGQ